LCRGRPPVGTRSRRPRRRQPRKHQPPSDLDPGHDPRVEIRPGEPHDTDESGVARDEKATVAVPPPVNDESLKPLLRRVARHGAAKRVHDAGVGYPGADRTSRSSARTGRSRRRGVTSSTICTSGFDFRDRALGRGYRFSQRSRQRPRGACRVRRSSPWLSRVLLLAPPAQPRTPSPCGT
jgi:hypothetical protein